MLVCFAIATHHGAQGTLWRAAGSDLRFTRKPFLGNFAKMIEFDFRYFVDYLGVKWERRHALRVVGGYPYMATRGIIVTSVTLLATFFKVLLYPLALTLYIYTYDKGADKKDKTKARAVYKINMSFLLFMLMLLRQFGGADLVCGPSLSS